MKQRHGFGGLLNMRFYGFAVAVAMVGLRACAGGDARPGDTTAVGIDTTATTTTVASGTTTPTDGSTGTMATITSTTNAVKREGDAKGYRFVTDIITVKQGDDISWKM